MYERVFLSWNFSFSTSLKETAVRTQAGIWSRNHRRMLLAGLISFVLSRLQHKVAASSIYPSAHLIPSCIPGKSDTPHQGSGETVYKSLTLRHKGPACTWGGTLACHLWSRQDHLWDWKVVSGNISLSPRKTTVSMGPNCRISSRRTSQYTIATNFRNQTCRKNTSLFSLLWELWYKPKFHQGIKETELFIPLTGWLSPGRCNDPRMSSCVSFLNIMA